MSFDVKSLFTNVPLDYTINNPQEDLCQCTIHKYKQEGSERTFTFMYKKCTFYF